ncbi:MAG: hypothetical protein Q9180_006280 [Flavoplaca navasiana]
MEGYAKLASIMGAHPEAELTALEQTLRACTEKNIQSSDADRTASARDWYTLSRLGSGSNGTGDTDAGEEWRTVLEIREKVKEYSPWSSID